MSEKYSDELLDGLTDEERAALDEPDDTTSTMESAYKEGDDGNGKEGQDGARGKEAEDGQDKDDGKTAADAKDAGDAGAGGGDDGADAGEGNASAADAGADAAPVADHQPAPLLIAEAPADAEGKLKEISSKKDALIEQFDNGDITAKEYQTGLDALNKEERAIERAVEKAQIAAEMRQQQEANNWMAKVRDFTTKTQPEYSTSKVRWMALDNFVKEIANNPENANMTYAELLAEAHKRVVDDLGEATPAPATKAKKDGAPLKGSKAEPPKTLGKVPAADNNTVEDGRWAALDRLRDTDPMLHEEKLMKLSEAERDEYLARA